MKSDIKDTSETRKVITVKVPASEIASLEKQLVVDFSKQAKIPGFRAGKVPESMVRSRFAKDIKDELKTRLVQKAYSESVEKAEFEVFQTLDVDVDDVEVGKDHEVVLTIDILPQFELPEYEGIEVTSMSTEVSDEEVDRMQNQILSQRAEFEVAEKAAEAGDYVQCAYEGKIGDELVADLVPESPMYGTQKSTWEEAGAEHAPGVRAVIDGLVGMKAGDTKEVTMDFPEDFKPEALAGKQAVYSIEAKEVREKIMPELTEELLKSFGAESEASLKDQIRESLLNQKKQQNVASERQQISEELISRVEFPLPESAIEAETQVILRDFMQRNLQQGVSEEELEKNKESLHAGATNGAINRIKSRLILLKIGQKEKVTVEQDDFGRFIMNEAQQTNRKPDQIVKDLQKNQARVDGMRREILLGKTMDILVQKCVRKTEDGEAKKEDK